MKKHVLFVCLGNICRSPSAEAVFKAKVSESGMQDQYFIDSAGTSGYHRGQNADSRMQLHATKRGYNLTSISRPFEPETDFEIFDWIIAMDEDNLYNLQQMARNDSDLDKIHLMTDFGTINGLTGVPDPYYGGSKGFEQVLDLLEEGCQGLLKATNREESK